MWTTGEIIASDTSALYAGSQLSDNTTYYVRIRVHNGSDWGDWNMNWFFIRPNIISVPGMAPTIQAGIDLAGSDDTILVDAGIYNGNGNRDLAFGGKSLVILAQYGPENTIIDCEGSDLDPHRAFSFTNGEDSSSIVEGFTITGGYGHDEYVDNIGGAVYCMQSSPTFKNCRFTSNTGDSFGGAVAAFISSPAFIECCFDSNYANYGGAVYMVGAVPSKERETYTTVFDSCDFYGNSASSGDGYGGAIYCHLGDIKLTMTHCLAYDNTAGYGGGLAAAFISTVDLINCTFASNSALFGAGVFLDGEITASLENNIIAFNQSGEGVFCDDLVYLEQLTCNDIYGNDGGDTVLCVLPQTEVYGNFSLDPKFCDINANHYSILNQSPCRPYFNDCGLLIGAKDDYCFEPMCGDANGDGLVNVSDVVYIINYVFISGPRPVPLACGDSNDDGTVNVSDAVYLIGYIFVSGPLPDECQPGSSNWIDGDCPPFQ